MTVSFPHFSTMDVLKEKMDKYIDDVKGENDLQK
jgi:hypothetical protein